MIRVALMFAFIVAMAWLVGQAPCRPGFWAGFNIVLGRHC